MPVTTSYIEDILAKHGEESLRPCVSLVKEDGQKINYIDGIGEVREDFLIVTEAMPDGLRVVARIPMESIREWRNREDYSTQAWRWYGS